MMIVHSMYSQNQDSELLHHRISERTIQIHAVKQGLRYVSS